MNSTNASLVESYVSATNAQDAEAFLAVFADDAIVDDVGREIRGRDAIRSWSEREIFHVNVTLKPLQISEIGEEVLLTVEVDGDFDRTGLPNPLVMTHLLNVSGCRIGRLTCRLAEAPIDG